MPHNAVDKSELLEIAKKWFRKTLALSHIANTEKLRDPRKFSINPFLVMYLSNFLTGNNSPTSLAKALVYPRVLGTSITTSFGQHLQKFISEALKPVGSIAPGIDIEFIDQVDGRLKYCQLKGGPNTINKHDVETIHNHFADVRNLARTNNRRISIDDMVVGILYGEYHERNVHYKRLETKHNYPVFVGQDFWHRLTGDKDFYFKLGEAFSSIAAEFDSSKLLDDVIKGLSESETIRKLAREL